MPKYGTRKLDGLLQNLICKTEVPDVGEPPHLTPSILHIPVSFDQNSRIGVMVIQK